MQPLASSPVDGCEGTVFSLEVCMTIDFDEIAQ